MSIKENYLQMKIDKAISAFRTAYAKEGFLRLDFGKGIGTEDSPCYGEILTADNRSKIVGNSSFSPRMRRKPVYYPGQITNRGWAIPHHYEFVLSIHPYLHDGIEEVIRPEDIKEVYLSHNLLNRKCMEKIVRDFLKLSNAEVLEKYVVNKNIFSKKSLDIMEAVDRKNARIAELEQSIEEGAELDSKLNAKIAERVRVPEERVIA